jgi:N-acetylglucosamine-6-phosphate deacetylase
MAVEVIADGCHLREPLRLVCKIKARKNLSGHRRERAAGLPEGEYLLAARRTDKKP